jgi:hypothetical protein
MKPIDLNKVPAQDWLTLRLDQLDTPYQAILSGDVTFDQMEAFCGAIRYTLFEFSANVRRSPGRFTDTARTLITVADHVIKCARASRLGKSQEPKWNLVINSILSHRKQFETLIQESARAEKKMAAARRRETQRIADLVGA